MVLAVVYLIPRVMFAKIASALLGTSAKQTDDGGEGEVQLDDQSSNALTSTAYGSQSVPVVFAVALFKIDGSDVQLLRQKAIVSFGATELQVLIPGEKAEVDFVIPFSQLCAVRQHRPTTSQFLWRRSKEESQEIGLQFVSAEAAFEFRDELIGALAETCDVLLEAHVDVALFEPEEKVFQPWMKDALMALARREDDGLATLTLLKDKDIVFQSELSRDIQLWQTPDLKEFTMLGPYIKKDADELVRSLFLFKVQEDCNTSLEIFRILEKLVGYEEKLVRNEDFDMGDSTEGEESTEQAKEVAWSSDEQDSSAVAQDSEPCSLARGLSDEDYSGDEERYKEKPPVRVKRSSIVNDPSELIIEKDPTAKLHRFMQVGEQHSFVCRSTDLGNENIYFKDQDKADFDLHVYGRGKDTKLADLTMITGDKFEYNKRNIAPAKGLLHNEESKLLLLDDKDKNAVYYMDIERQKIVSRFDTEGLPASILCPTFKEGGRSQDPTFTCANSRALYMMDSRQKSARVHTLEYKTNPNFSAAATDEHGHIVLGSRTGTLRLYDGEPNKDGKYKIAKTQLETFNEPIKSVDVTKDGSWILATTRNCLILFNTRLKSTGKTGFETRLGKTKPTGIYLRLSEKDVVKYGLTNIDFAAAVFDASNDNILTSTGNLAIIWDFKAIRRGQWPVNAKIKLTDAFIKDTKAMQDGSVIVAYPQDLDVLGVRRV